MSVFSRLLFSALLAFVALSAFAVDVPAPAAPEAALSYMNRTVMVFRGELAGATPQQRAQRARQRIEEAEQRNLADKVTPLPVALGSQQGVGIFAGDLLLFTVLPEDVSPEEDHDTQALAQQVKLRMESAFVAWHEQQNPVLLGKALIKMLIAAVLTTLAAWLVWRLRGWVTQRMQAFIEHKLSGDLPWVGYMVQVFERIVQIVIGLLLFAFAYLLLTYALSQFPLTQPFADRLGQFLVDLLAGIGRSVVAALPNLVTLVVILLITRALVQSVHAIFDAVQENRIEFPGLHRETLGATRRIVVVAMWALGFTFCYPYIPGSQSDVFKGLSVLFGFMLTLGSAGMVSQLMSGMTLIYSRALRRGDLVQVGDMVGVVEEIGGLSTKFINLYNEEITIPNAVLVSNPIRNLSRLHESQGVWIGTKVTIGYDTPWRQVEAMLTNAASRVPELKNDPAPFVLQSSLSDFYVEYELVAAMASPFGRALLLSKLHREIQDEFNTYGVQIMSPNFEAQPDGAVLVPKEDWFKAPARPVPGQKIPE
jgi:small-conductance mechanosensitive channel